MEQLEYNLLFRWFVGLSMDDPVWDHSVFSKNRERLIASDVATAFFARIKAQAEAAGLLSDEHFTVDGALIEAWASLKSFRPKDQPSPPATGGRNPEVDFRGQRRTNATHASTTDPDARLFTKGPGQTAKLCYMGHVLMENRHGLVVSSSLTMATGTAEREAAMAMIEGLPHLQGITLGADKFYDQRAFVRFLQDRRAEPHVARRRRGSALDEAISRKPGYLVSQRLRKLVEQVFGWTKTIGILRKTRHRGRERVSWVWDFTMAAYNLVRMRNLGFAASP
jgi:IS5 family transposase